MWAVLLLVHFVFSQQTVHLETTRYTWADAENFCIQRGGHLVSIHNAFQASGFTDLARSTDCQFYYTGGVCNNGQCTWTDGTSFNYANWLPGEPNKDAPYISVGFYTGTWKTVSGNTGYCFLCESNTLMTDCLDWYKAGYKDDGLYTITAGSSNQPVTVWCDMTTDGGGWTLFQNRIDGTESFWNRTWNEYKTGFGSPQGNYWAGNELIHKLTTKDTLVTLKIEMNKDGTPGSPFPNNFWWNNYDAFQVTDESDNYRLRLSIDWQNVKGNASTGWYDITYSSGAPFSTVDRINDPRPDCITKYQMGGWWLYNCAFASLNGAYTPIDWNTGYGIFFLLNGGDVIIHPRQTTMKLRAVK